MIDVGKLRSFAIPDGRQWIDKRVHALYALSIGFGRDPLDERELPFVAARGKVEPVPSVVLVLAHPGFWTADHRSGVEGSRVLHADQSFEILDTIPIEGWVESRSRLIGLIDKGPGKAALLRVETLLTTRRRLFARLRRTMLLQGGGGFGGRDEQAPAAIRFDGPPSIQLERSIRPEQALLYRLNGDFNPLHCDPAASRLAGFERPIFHGLGTVGVIAHALIGARDYQPTSLTSMTVRLCAPLYPGETLKVELWRDRFRAIVESRATTVATGTLSGPEVGSNSGATTSN